MMSEYKRWLESDKVPLDLKKELQAIEGDIDEIKERFSAHMSFGTAGLRGIMGAGIARMNLLTVSQATQAIAALIIGEGKEKAGCAICHDCRNFSREFAEAAACVLAANGITVRIFESMRPTPELSFAVRYHNCVAGINITASHNPKEYNGYKVYWSDGAQLPPAHANAVAAEMRKIDVLDGAKTMSMEQAVKSGLIIFMGEETDEAYYKSVLEQSIINENTARELDGLRVVYTPFHGAGARPVPEILQRIGLKKLYCVEAQMEPDGNFSTVKSPNPEEPEGFAMAEELAKIVSGELIIATDPDSDRVGAMCLHKNEYVRITGNQMGALLTDYILSARRDNGTMPENAAIIKTIVTTELAREVAKYYGAECIDTFTGFKFMAERIKEYEESGQYKVLFSFEESYGYMPGTFVRDKDAVAASMLIVEMAAYHKSNGKTLVDALNDLYTKFGYYCEETINIKITGIDGQKKMESMMADIRNTVPVIEGIKIEFIKDYLDGICTNVINGTKVKMDLKGSNVLAFEFQGGAKLLVRPSGTEPKLKLYILAKGETEKECAKTVKFIRSFEKIFERVIYDV